MYIYFVNLHIKSLQRTWAFKGSLWWNHCIVVRHFLITGYLVTYCCEVKNLSLRICGGIYWCVSIDALESQVPFYLRLVCYSWATSSMNSRWYCGTRRSMKTVTDLWQHGSSKCCCGFLIGYLTLLVTWWNTTYPVLARVMRFTRFARGSVN